jgi:hypothetical protein
LAQEPMPKDGWTWLLAFGNDIYMNAQNDLQRRIYLWEEGNIRSTA